MIGIGKWEFGVKSMFYSGKIKLNIFDDGGKYGYELDMPGMKIPEINVINIKKDGNIVDATLQAAALPGKDILVHAEFDGDRVEGYARLPILGKVKMLDGHRIP